jgi:hypothetical protein
VTGTCACGEVSVTLESRPEFINDCNCTLCRKAGAAWGYFAPSSVRVVGNTVAYARRDKTAPAVEVHSCATCATTTHWVLTRAFKEKNPSVDQVGVNMRLFDPDDMKGVELRFPDGKAWAGEGPFGYRRAAMSISDTMPW